MKILHTADIHLRKLDDERWRALERLVELGRSEEIDVLAISGDLFNSGVDAEQLRPAMRRLFSDTGFEAVLIPGNHDKECYRPGLHFGDNVHIISDPREPFEHKDLCIWGLPFQQMTGEKVLDMLRIIGGDLRAEKTNILLYHGELLDASFSRQDMGEGEGEDRYMPVKLSYFDELKIDYVLAGHFHTTFRSWPLKKGGYFVYPGSPVSITKRETGRRKVNLFNTGEPPRERLIDTPHFEEKTVELDPLSDKDPAEEVREALSGADEQAKILLSVTGYIDSKKTGITEKELVQRIKELGRGRVVDLEKGDFARFKDISDILEDELFQSFIDRLDKKEYDDKKKKRLRETVIRAMTIAKFG